MNYELVRTRRKTIAITIDSRGRVVVRAPLRLESQRIERFLSEKNEWIAQHQDRILARGSSAARSYTLGEQFLFLGQTLRLVVAHNGVMCRVNDELHIPSHIAASPRERMKKWYAREAEIYVSQRVAYYAPLMQTSVAKVRVNNARRQWGSCSRAKAVSFSWRLIMAPPTIVDYVVVHELAHTQVHNHSIRFWQVVKQIYPEYLIARKWLAENGWRLDLPPRCET
jgi:hypothetical protein